MDRSPAPQDNTAAAVWHTLAPEEALLRLGCPDGYGLNDDEVNHRLERHGANRLTAAAVRGPWQILAEQLRGSLLYLLLAAAGLSMLLGETRDAVAILTIVVLNTLLGFVQDYRAERAMAALQRLSEPRARVRRGGVELRVETQGLVPGDLLLLTAGDRVAADARLLEAFDLHVEEAALTGESQAVVKDAAPLAERDLPLGDRAPMVYQGTLITNGRASAVVVTTGMETELGKIAGLLQAVKREPTPLQRRLSRLGRDLSLAAILMVMVVIAIGLLRGEDFRLVAMVGLALAVAAVPEGLPAVATVALALGARHMLAKNALIRKLPAVETLGSVTVICSDKTGTLTRNQMTVTALNPMDGPLAIKTDTDAAARELLNRPAAGWLLLAGVLCNDTVLTALHADTEGLLAEGDPTEIALAQAALHFGLDRTHLDHLFPRVGEMPFDAERRRMSTVHTLPRDGGNLPPPIAAAFGALGSTECQAVILTKGAEEAVLDVSTRVFEGGGFQTLDASKRRQIEETEATLADRGMRVLGLALRPVDAIPASDAHDLEHDLIFLGLVGISDPLRPNVQPSVEHCRRAGIRPVMITGDHPRTAVAIAREAGIAVAGRVLEGRRLAALSADELDQLVEEVEVYARVSPEDKLRIVTSLKRHGHIVAMTGDGVNDAPSLRRADIGVAMGVIGTDVAREAAEMVLLDDDFSTIVAAVRQGRRVYDNIRRFLIYTLASNTGEIVTMVLAPLFGMPLALLPLQILWINLVTDGLPGLALGVERAERGVMTRPPVPPKARLLGRQAVVNILWIGLLMGAVALGSGYFALHWGGAAEDAHWRTIIFTVLTLSQMGNALALRTFHEGFRQRPLLSSPALAAAVALTFGLQLAVIYLPFLQQIFSTVALSLTELTGCVVASTLVFWAVEGKKWLARRSGTAK